MGKGDYPHCADCGRVAYRVMFGLCCNCIARQRNGLLAACEKMLRQEEERDWSDWEEVVAGMGEEVTKAKESGIWPT